MILVWLWLKKWWKLLAGAVALVGAFFIGFLIRKPKTAVLPTDPAGKTDAEKDAQDQIAKVRIDAAEKEREVIADALEDRVENVDELRDSTVSTEGDPGKVNEYLRSAGDAVRGRE